MLAQPAEVINVAGTLTNHKYLLGLEGDHSIRLPGAGGASREVSLLCWRSLGGFALLGGWGASCCWNHADLQQLAAAVRALPRPGLGCPGGLAWPPLLGARLQEPPGQPCVPGWTPRRAPPPTAASASGQPFRPPDSLPPLGVGHCQHQASPKGPLPGGDTLPPLSPLAPTSASLPAPPLSSCQRQH